MSTLQRFHDEIARLLRRIATEEQEAITRAATLLADVVARDHLIYVFGTGAHSYIGAEEMFYRSGGLAAVYPIFDPGVSLAFGARRSTAVERLVGYAPRVLAGFPLTSQDALVIVNAYGINAVTIEAALWAREHRVPTIAVTSPEFSRATPADHPARPPSRQNLCDLVDYMIDTKMPLRDAALSLDGVKTFPAVYILGGSAWIGERGGCPIIFIPFQASRPVPVGLYSETVRRLSHRDQGIQANPISSINTCG